MLTAVVHAGIQKCNIIFIDRKKMHQLKDDEQSVTECKGVLNEH